MKVIIKKTSENYFQSPCYNYVEIKNYCCEKMENAMNDDAIKFGEFESMLNTNKFLNIFRCLPYPEGACWDEYEIDYCPFCGEKIDYVESQNTKKEEGKVK